MEETPIIKMKERSTPLSELEIPEEAMEKLKFNIRMARNQRREIARKNKYDWKVYRYIEMEVVRRLRNNLDIYTGKIKE